MRSRKLGTVCETSEKTGLPLGSETQCQVPSGNEIAGQIMCQRGHDRLDATRASPAGSSGVSEPARVYGPSNRMAGPEQLG